MNRNNIRFHFISVFSILVVPVTSFYNNMANYGDKFSIMVD